VHDKVVFAGSGKLGFPETALLAFGLGCDLINVAREAFLTIGASKRKGAIRGIVRPVSRRKTV
jgi:hypothetical protein